MQILLRNFFLQIILMKIKILQMSCLNGHIPNNLFMAAAIQRLVYSKQVNTRMLLPKIDTPSSHKK